jgi:ribokinase
MRNDRETIIPVKNSKKEGSKQGKVLVFGAAVIDVGFHLHEDTTPAPDTSTQAKKITLAPGGKGLTQAIALSRLEFDVSLVTVIGNKIFSSSIILDLLDSEYINTDFINIIEDKMTPITGIITLSHQKSSCAICNKREDELKITTAYIDNIFNSNDINNFDFILITYELTIDTVSHILKKLCEEKYKNITVIVTPAPPASDSIKKSYLKRINYLVTNVWEIQKLLLVDSIDISTLTSALITDGVEGTICILADKRVIIKSSDIKTSIEDNLHDTAQKHDKAAERDAFCAALAYTLQKNKGNITKKDMPFIIAAMALSTGQIDGAYTAMPTIQEIDDYMLQLSG